MSEDITIRHISFPVIPDSVSDDLKEYLQELQVVLEDALKGSSLLENTFENGKLGN